MFIYTPLENRNSLLIDRKVVGSNAVTVIFEESGVKATLIRLFHQIYDFTQLGSLYIVASILFLQKLIIP
jgi:hypothetical protein